MISNHDRENIERIIVDGYGDWFTARLLRLMHKADSENFAKLAVVFPEEAAAYILWQTGETLPLA